MLDQATDDAANTYATADPVDQYERGVEPLLNVDFASLSVDERLAYIDFFDDVLESLNRRAARLKAAIAVAEWRAEIHQAVP
jgi:hypothetical protein